MSRVAYTDMTQNVETAPASVIEVTRASSDADTTVLDAMPDVADDQQAFRAGRDAGSATVANASGSAAANQPSAQSAAQSSAQSTAQSARVADVSATTDPEDVITSGSAVVGSNHQLWEDAESDENEDDDAAVASAVAAQPHVNETAASDSASHATDTTSDASSDID